MRRTVWIAVLLICMAGCAPLVQQSSRNHVTNAGVEKREVLRVALTDWFSHDNPPIPAPGSDMVWICCPAFGKSERVYIPGVKTAFASLEDLQLRDPDRKPMDYWIRVSDLVITGDVARLTYYAKSAKWHQWANVSYELRQSGKRWIVTRCGSAT